MTNEPNSQDRSSQGRKAQAREIFMEIIDLPEEERQSKLDELCADDAMLKLDVEVLLMSHDNAGGFMSNPTESLASAPITEKAGTIIGPYKLLQEIGEGGFGTVFLADQSKPIRRRVALKIIKLGMDTKQVIARFEAERQALALMDHPHIARVLDAGATETGRPYFVMEYVVGDSITAFADAHKLSVRERLELFNQACSAVQHAHQKGIIHRDIKPSNILVNMTDGRPFAKVIDFGIAKATAAPLTEKTLFTEHHQLIGTLEYMSPEQAEGLPDIDTRTDVYALGVLLYELLTGQTPIDGKRLRSAAWHEMRRIIKEEEPPAPSMRLSRNIYALAQVASARQVEPNKLSAQLKGELDWIAIKALDKDRARRYETPNALAQDVQRHLDGDAVVAAPVSRAYKMRKFVRRNKGPVIAGSAVVAALMVGIAGTSLGLWRAERANSAKDVAIQSELEAKDDAQWDSYTANLALAQIAMDNGNWPEARDRIAACPESKRGWEWEFLSNKAGSVIREFAGYGGRYSPSNQLIITEIDNSRVYVWDMNGNLISKFQIPERISSTRFSPDGQFILVLHASLDSISVWTISGEPYGKPFHVEDELKLQYHHIQSAIFANDSKDLLIRLGRMVLTFDIKSGTTHKIGENSFMAKDGLEKSSLYGHFVLSVYRGDKHSMQVFNSHGESVGESIPQDSHSLFSSFRHDGEQFVSISEGRTARIWDIKGNAIGNPMQHQEFVRDTLFSPDGNTILTVDDLNTVRFWDDKGLFLDAQILHQKWNGSPLYSPDGQHLITSSNGQLHLWDNEHNLLSVVETSGHSGMFEMPDLIEAIAFTDDGQSVLLRYGSYMEGAAESIRTLPFPWISSIRSLEAKDHVYGTPISYAISELRIAAELYDPNTPAAPANNSRYWFDDPDTIITTHPDGSRIVTAAADSTVRFWDPETEKELAAIPVDAGVTNLTFTPDGTRLVIELDDGSARIFDTRSAEEQAADVQRRWAERVPAGEYLDTLMAGPTPTDELMSAIETDDTLTPLRRLAAAEVLMERLTDIKSQADRAFEAITKDQTDKAQVLTAAHAADLPPRVKEQVLAKAEAWEYTPPKVTEEAKKQRLAKVGTIVNQLLNTELPYLGDNRPKLVEAVEARIALFGEAHPESMVASWVLGAMDFYEGRREIGLERMRATAKLYEQWTPTDYDGYLLFAMYDNLIQAELITGHIKEAEDWLDKMVVALDMIIADDINVGWHGIFYPGQDVVKSGFLPRVLELDYRRNFELPEHPERGDESQKEYLVRIADGLREVQRIGLRETVLRQTANRDTMRLGRNLFQQRIVDPNDKSKHLTRITYFPSNFDPSFVANAFPNDQRSQRPFALASYREGEYKAALDAITLAAQYRAAMLDDPATEMDESSPHPYDAAILAMSHFQLAQPLPESDPARAEHLAAANEALAQCQAIMADPAALDPDGNPWAEDRIAQSLLAEAEALIGGGDE